MAIVDTPVQLKHELQAAQKTVTVLKARVRSLYNEGAQTAIHQQLALAQRRQEDNRRKRAVMQAKNQALERHSAHLEAQVQERTRALQSILDNVVFGFLIVDQDSKVQPGFTKSCAELLGKPVQEGLDLCALLGVQDPSRQAEVELGVEQVFDDFMPEQVSLDQIPSRFPLGERVLRCQGRAIRDPEGQVSGILFTLSDVTELEEARKEAHNNAVLVGILRQKAAFAAFVDDAFARLSSAEENLHDQPFVRRAVHTVKGNAASYGLSEVAQSAHQAEAFETIEAAQLEDLRCALEDFLATNDSVLNLSQGEGCIELPLSELEAMRAMLTPVNRSGLARWSAFVAQRPARDLIGPVEVFIERLAERLDRQVQFTVTGAETPVDPECTGDVLRNVTHLLRNAMDHGLEPDWERGDKPAVGALSLDLSREDEGWQIVVADDGRGIQVDTVTQRATEEGRISAAEASEMGREEKLNLIFLDGLSSKFEATEISGRGVGMSAMREAVERAGGVLKVETEIGRGTRIVIHIPMPDLMRGAA